MTGNGLKHNIQFILQVINIPHRGRECNKDQIYKLGLTGCIWNQLAFLAVLAEEILHLWNLRSCKKICVESHVYCVRAHIRKSWKCFPACADTTSRYYLLLPWLDIFVSIRQDELFMHLTNYSINKHNENFDKDDKDDSGSKRYGALETNYRRASLCSCNGSKSIA